MLTSPQLVHYTDNGEHWVRVPVPSTPVEPLWQLHELLMEPKCSICYCLGPKCRKHDY